MDHHQRGVLQSSRRDRTASIRAGRVLGQARQDRHRRPSEWPDLRAHLQRSPSHHPTMKLISLCLAVTAASVSAQTSTYVNFVRQTQQGTGVVWDMPVAATGSGASSLLL